MNKSIHTCRINNGIKNVMSSISAVALIFRVLCNIKAEQGIHTNGLKLTVTACRKGLESVHIRALTCAYLVVG